MRPPFPSLLQAVFLRLRARRGGALAVGMTVALLAGPAPAIAQDEPVADEQQRPADKAPVAFEAPVEVVGDEVGYGPDSIRLAEDHWRPIRTALDRPAVLCDACHDRMRAGGFTGFLDFRFSLHPACPACSAHWTMRTIAGFIAAPPREPWIWHTGCCPQQRWKCGACGHNFGGNFEFGGH